MAAPEASPAPASRPAPTQETGNPVDEQIAAQGMRRRQLSEGELSSIRAAMSDLQPNAVPRFNPLQAYPFLGNHNLPPEERAREIGADRLFGFQPRNRVTAREIIEDIDRQLAERRR